MATFNFNDQFPEATNEQKLEQVRDWRNYELSCTDWTQVADAPVDAAAWAIYRQQLRDLPSTINLDNPVIPDPPT